MVCIVESRQDNHVMIIRNVDLVTIFPPYVTDVSCVVLLQYETDLFIVHRLYMRC